MDTKTSIEEKAEEEDEEDEEEHQYEPRKMTSSQILDGWL